MALLLAHAIGDFLLQPKWMAVTKGSNSLVCSLHVALYTAAIMLVMWESSPALAVAIYVPHWIIDRWSLADWWSTAIHGRTLAAAWTSEEEYREFDIAFTAVVYTVIDTTLHMACLMAAFHFLAPNY